MDLPARAALVVVVLIVAALAWTVLTARRGRLVTTTTAADLPAVWSGRAGSTLTLVQISSEQCSSCSRARAVWQRAIGTVDGATHLEVDAADHLPLVRELDILTTPTTLVYDGDGVLRGRVVGAPTAAQARDALAAVPIGAHS